MKRQNSYYKVSPFILIDKVLRKLNAIYWLDRHSTILQRWDNDIVYRNNNNSIVRNIRQNYSNKNIIDKLDRL